MCHLCLRPLNPRSHIDLGCNCFLFFTLKNLSGLVQQWLDFHFRKRKAKTYLGCTLLPPSHVMEKLLAVAP